jgi:hypothetical protein
MTGLLLGNRYLWVLSFVLISGFLFAQPPCNEEIAEPTAGCPEAPIVCELDFFLLDYADIK